jgi:hypothetical protein
MRVLTRPCLLAAATIAAITCVQTDVSWGQAAAVHAASGGCYPVDYTWICVYSGGTGGKPGSGASATYTCTYTPAGPGILQRTGTGPPQPGYQWDIMTCPGSSGILDGELIQVSIKTGAPAVSPVQLLQVAIGDLRVPRLTAMTAPPRGKRGLVGLPEWFWVPPGEWQPVSITVQAGPVWATAVAAPAQVTFAPGAGLAAVSCPGPGTAYDPALPAARQRTRCSYTYLEPSAGQPANSYQAALAVSWRISWTGSGGSGGVITNDYSTDTALRVRIAQGEALVTSP